MKSFLLALCFISTNALAWGPIGHRTVGEIAQKFLSVDALTKVNQILNGQTLARVSTWPDEIKSDPQHYAYTFNWHYTTWPMDVYTHTAQNEDASTGYLLTQLEENFDVLRNPNKTNDEKAFALKFVVHLMGDLHMPLHVGNGLDLGGNNCKVSWYGKMTNLHHVWDEGMFDAAKLSYTELAKFISQGRTTAEIQKWNKGSIVEWAKESVAIRETLYPEEVSGLNRSASTKSYCHKDASLTGVPELGYDYSYKFLPVAEIRVYQAGLRLGTLLNQYLK